MFMLKTILVADDKANVRNLLREYLEAEGFRVVIAANGREALYTARQAKPDLILLDIMMPEMNGYQVLEQMKLRFEEAGIGASMLKRQLYVLPAA